MLRRNTRLSWSRSGFSVPTCIGQLGAARDGAHVIPSLVLVNAVIVVLVGIVAVVLAFVIVFANAVNGLFLLLLWSLQDLAVCRLARCLARRSACLTASQPVASGGKGGDVWTSNSLSLRCSVAGE